MEEVSKLLQLSVKRTINKKIAIFGYYIPDPENFGVVDFDDNHKALSIMKNQKI